MGVRGGGGLGVVGVRGWWGSRGWGVKGGGGLGVMGVRGWCGWGSRVVGV